MKAKTKLSNIYQIPNLTVAEPGLLAWLGNNKTLYSLSIAS